MLVGAAIGVVLSFAAVGCGASSVESAGVQGVGQAGTIRATFATGVSDTALPRGSASGEFRLSSVRAGEETIFVIAVAGRARCTGVLQYWDHAGAARIPLDSSTAPDSGEFSWAWIPPADLAAGGGSFAMTCGNGDFRIPFAVHADPIGILASR